MDQDSYDLASGGPIASPEPGGSATATSDWGAPGTGSPGPPWPPEEGHRRRWLLPALIAVLALIVAEVAYSWTQAGHYYTISPGTAPVVSDSPSCRPSGDAGYQLPGGQPCVRIELPSGRAGSASGSILMVDVLLGKSRPQDFFLHQVHLLHWLEDGTVLVPASEVLGSTPASQLGCQDTQQMTDSTTAAALAALRRLGYSVVEQDHGAQVDVVVPRSPATAAGMQCNDLITAIDGQPVASADELVAAIHSRKPGTTVHLTVTRKGARGPVELTARLSGTPASDGQVANPSRAFLGVSTETRSSFTYPFSLRIDVGQIGGPSAGLALTLALIDSLSGGHLTGGLKVAATGTIAPDGEVGDVGGVAQKTVAVRDAGAKVFFVPVQELAVARAEAGSMKVYAVSSLEEALDRLAALGGTVPAPSTPAQSPPSTSPPR